MQGRWLWLAVAVPAAAAAVAACGTGRANRGGGAESHETSAGTCAVFDVRAGRLLEPAEVARLGDPIADRVLRGGSACPLTFQDIQKKLAITDAQKEFFTGEGQPPRIVECQGAGGLGTRLVTNRSQLLNVPDDYRAVITRQCADRQPHELLMNLFGVRPADVAAELPSELELIGMKRVDAETGAASSSGASGVFNYYALEGAQWKFFGSSEDFVTGGYDCNDDGACIPKVAQKARCASCHPGGGST